MFMIPYRADVAMSRWPYANWVIMGLCVVVYGLTAGEVLPEHIVNAMTLHGWGLSGLLGHMWLHAGLFHLLGNMVFLWVFGNAVCAKLGNIAFPFVYVGLGLVGAATANWLTPAPAVGASGAINGIVGMFLVLYPLNEVSLFYAIFLFVIRAGLYTLSSMWVILLWLLFDVWTLFRGGEAIGYAAHVGGFVGGVALALILLKLRILQPEAGERTLLDLFGRKRVYPMAGRLREPDEAYVPPPASPSPAPSIEAPVMATLQEINAQFITFKCPCGKTLKTSRQYAGRHVKCPVCTRRVQIPS